MADDKIYAFKFEARGITEIDKQIATFALDLKKTNEELQKMKNAAPTEENIARFAALTVKSDGLKNTIKLLSKEAGSSSDSLNKMRAELIKLKDTYGTVDEAGRQRLIPQIAKLNDEISRAEQAVGVYQRNVGNYGSALAGLGKHFLTFIGASIGVTGAFEAIKKVIGSTEETTDRLEQRVAQLEGGFQGLFRTIATGDWSGLIANMKTSSEAAKKLKEEEQELEHVLTGMDVAVSELSLKLAETKNKIAETLDPHEKQVYIKEAIDLQRQIIAIQVAGAEERAGLDKDYYKTLSQQDEEYFKSFIKRVPEISKSYKMQYELLDGYKQRLNRSYI